MDTFSDKTFLGFIAGIIVTSILSKFGESIFGCFKKGISCIFQFLKRIFVINRLKKNASIYLKKAQPNEAKKSYETANKLVNKTTNFTDYCEILIGKIVCDFELRNYQNVVDNFKKLWEDKILMIKNPNKIVELQSVELKAIISLSKLNKTDQESLDEIEEGIKWCQELALVEQYIKMPKFWLTFGNISFNRARYLNDANVFLETLSYYKTVEERCMNRTECKEDTILAKYRIGRIFYNLYNLSKEPDYIDAAIKNFNNAIDGGLSVEKHLDEYAQTLNTLGLCHQKLFEMKDDKENLNKARDYFLKRIKTIGVHKNQETIPHVHVHLGMIYNELSKINESSGNILTAISECEVALHLAEEGISSAADNEKDVFEEACAYAKYFLGRLLTSKSKIRDTRNELKTAEGFFNESLNYYEKNPTDPRSIKYSGLIHRNLMNISCQMSEFEYCESNIEKAIKIAQKCEEHLKNNKSEYPEYMLQLGETFLRLAFIRKSEENANTAIKFLDNVQQSSVNISQWCQGQLAYANAYILLSNIRNHTYNINKSKEFLDRIKSNNSIKKFPYLYNSIFGVYGVLYCKLAEDRDRTNNVNLACESLNLFKKVFTPELMPIYFARNRKNEGDVYICKALKNDKHDLNNALECYDEALKVFSEEKYILEIAEIYQKKAYTYWKLSKEKSGNEILFFHKDSTSLIEKALFSYSKALETFTKVCFPVQNSQIKSDVAEVLVDKFKLTNNSETLFDAERNCLDALTIITKEKYPIYFIKTASILGNIYLHLKYQDPSYMQKARTYYEFAFATCIGENSPELYKLRKVLQEIYNSTHGFAAAA